MTDEVRAAAERRRQWQKSLKFPSSPYGDDNGEGRQRIHDAMLLADAYLAAARADTGGERERKLREVFEVGYELRAFLFSSHCYDARDIGRFFAIDGLPKWVRELGKQYDAQVNWTREKDHGVFIVMKVFRDFFSTPAAPPPTPASREIGPDGRRAGKTKLVYDKERQEIVPVPTSQPTPAADAGDAEPWRQGYVGTFPELCSAYGRACSAISAFEDDASIPLDEHIATLVKRLAAAETTLGEAKKQLEYWNTQCLRAWEDRDFAAESAKGLQAELTRRRAVPAEVPNEVREAMNDALAEEAEYDISYIPHKAKRAVVLARYIRTLAAGDSDDELPVDEAWLRSLGAVGEDVLDIQLCNWLSLNWGNVSGFDIYGPGDHDWMHLKHIKTRGDVRRLCQCLGVTLEKKS